MNLSEAILIAHSSDTRKLLATLKEIAKKKLEKHARKNKENTALNSSFNTQSPQIAPQVETHVTQPTPVSHPEIATRSPPRIPLQEYKYLPPPQ